MKILLLQNNCINNGVKTALYDEISERRNTKGEWLLGVDTQNVPYLLVVTTQDKTRQRHVRHLLMTLKARSHAGA